MLERARSMLDTDPISAVRAFWAPEAAFFTRAARIASRTPGPMARRRVLAEIGHSQVQSRLLAGTSASVNGSGTVRNRRTTPSETTAPASRLKSFSFPGYRCGTTLINDFIRVCRNSTRHQCASGPSSFPPELGPFFVSVMQVFSDYDCSGRPSGGSGTDFPSLTAMTMTSICFSSERRTSRSRKRGGRCTPVWC